MAIKRSETPLSGIPLERGVGSIFENSDAGDGRGANGEQ